MIAVVPLNSSLAKEKLFDPACHRTSIEPNGLFLKPVLPTGWEDYPMPGPLRISWADICARLPP